LILLAFLDPTSFVSSWGYLAIFLLSVLQSCCVPTSSELTLGFGGVLAAQGKLSLEGVIAAGVAGEVVGAYIAWFIGRTGGRGFVDRYGRYALLTDRDLDRAEAWYQRHGRWGVFGSRLLPVVRNFVALPAGVAGVPLLRFGLLTFAGSLIWDTAMALIGYQLGSRWQSVMHGFSDAGYLLIGLAVLAVALFLVHRYRSYKAATALEGSGRAVPRAGGHFAGGRPEGRSVERPPAGGPPAASASVPPDLAQPGAVGLVEGQGRAD
jgi:membrane protein DedA with SNARE-associated domain